MLEVRGLSAGYGSIRALESVDLSVGTGRIVALLGSNGAGKTTLMRTITGLLRPTAGSVTVEGEKIDAWPSHRIFADGVALVPQGRLLFPEMTVVENLEQGGLVRLPHGEIAGRIEEMLRLFPRLGERARQRAAGLSGGEQQMLATARALMARPKLLLMDEPTTGLAPIIVAEMIRIIRTLKEAGQTILLVEQNVRMALDLSDHVYILRVGRIVHECATEELRDNAEILNSYFG